jgi:hypothetical protein
MRTLLLRPFFVVLLVVATLTVVAVGPSSAGKDGGVGRTHSGTLPRSVTGLQEAVGPFTGNIGISADGLGVAASSTGTISAKIPLADSSIVLALLYATTNSAALIDQIGFDGVVVPLTELPPSLFENSELLTFSADVTDLVSAAVGSGSGVFDFTVDESVTGEDTTLVDGEALIVVYENPGLPSREIHVLEGGLAGPVRDTISIPLLSPYSGGNALLGVGITFSFQDSSGPPHQCTLFADQRTIIKVEASRITPCAGHRDDGDIDANGALMTVGGFDDDIRTPRVTGEDDEKYNLAPYVPAGDDALDLAFENPSGDDSLFVLYVQTDL